MRYALPAEADTDQSRSNSDDAECALLCLLDCEWLGEAVPWVVDLLDFLKTGVIVSKVGSLPAWEWFVWRPMIIEVSRLRLARVRLQDPEQM
jgi:hypothetical protein